MKRERLTTRLAAAADDKRKKKPTNGDLIRNTEGFEYDKSKANVLKRSLHNINVSVGTLISAMKDMSVLRGAEITPDGMLGGRGFIMNFRELKSTLNQAVNDLSNITDTLADELTNPKWGLSTAERTQVKKEKQQVEDEVEDTQAEIREEPAEKDISDKEPAEEEEKENDEAISPEDVKDSAEVQSLKRYRELLDGDTNDKVASVLSRNIMANLTREN